MLDLALLRAVLETISAGLDGWAIIPMVKVEEVGLGVAVETDLHEVTTSTEARAGTPTGGAGDETEEGFGVLHGDRDKKCSEDTVEERSYEGIEMKSCGYCRLTVVRQQDVVDRDHG